MSTITSANAILLIAVDQVFSSPQQIQQFSADDVQDFEDIQIAEEMMGVDGVLTAGFINAPWVQSITLMADSPSTNFFETWAATEKANQSKYVATGSVTYPAIQKRYPLSRGFLRTVSPMAGAKKVLQPRKFSIVWQVGIANPTS